MACAVNLDFPGPPEDHKDLLLAAVCMVVFGVLGGVGGQVEDLHAEGLDPELGPGSFEAAKHNSLDGVDWGDGEIGHVRLLLVGPGWPIGFSGLTAGFSGPDGPNRLAAWG